MRKKYIALVSVILLVIFCSSLTLHSVFFLSVIVDHGVSHSDIMDFPVYPDDLVPKVLQGTDIKRNGWFPWIYGMCIDNDGQTLYLVISLNVGFGGSRARAYVKGTYLDVKPDETKQVYSDGILVIGEMPKIMIDFHHPHKVRVDFDSQTYMEFDLVYRGIPLWYGKTTNPNDCLNISTNMKCGGYDAPCIINGKIVRGTTTVTFTGYGDWEHIWLLGPNEWSSTRTKWIIFNDDNYAGAVVMAYDLTNKVILKQGRLTIVDSNTNLIFDDFTITDDGKQPINNLSINGTARDIIGFVQIPVILYSTSSSHIYDGVWTQFTMLGTINGQTFNGTCWSECHNNTLIPEFQTSIILIVMLLTTLLLVVVLKRQKS